MTFAFRTHVFIILIFVSIEHTLKAAAPPEDIGEEEEVEGGGGKWDEEDDVTYRKKKERRKRKSKREKTKKRGAYEEIQNLRAYNQGQLMEFRNSNGITRIIKNSRVQYLISKCHKDYQNGWDQCTTTHKK